MPVNLPPVPPGVDPTLGTILNRWLNQLKAFLNNIVQTIAIASANGFTGTVSTDGKGDDTITIGTSVTGVVKGSGGGLAAAVAGTDYLSPAGPLVESALEQLSGASYTVAATDVTLMFSAASTVTLPAVASSIGRLLLFTNVAAVAITSASSNVTPLGSGVAGTAILAATAGKFCLMQCDGTNWRILMGN